MINNKIVELEAGAGGKKSEELIGEIRKILDFKGKWKNTEDDGAVFELDNLQPHPPRHFQKNSEAPSPYKGEGNRKLVFTTDAFIVDPIFFPGGDIGKIAITGTINDLLVMGANPIGLSLSLVIEEGFPENDLMKIIKSINEVSRETKVPVVTGDTKVTEKGKIDKIEITTAGVGLANNIVSNSGAKPGDVVITSGDLGEHGVALLANRFNYRTKVKSDCHAFLSEVKAVRKYLTSVKDPTRGGSAAILNEIVSKSRVKIVLEENNLPFKKETVAISELLGIDKFSFPSEGRFIATVPAAKASKVLKILQKYNKEAKIIGKVEPALSAGAGVWLKTNIGGMKRIEVPRGKLIPRIC